jgi:DNA anti-recombination protein RmuC
MDADTPSFPELNKYMDLIISEQKALLDEINSFIEDIRKIKKNF